ncbi:MAG TPA: LamG domain-containing protein, partial [Pirellulaceae bacterium]|nr:LamG domain-containing protein [Pirellulaceae bacterium]
MTPQSWMVPSQKYDVIHYIRQAYLETSNATQYFEIDEAYLASLPKGDTFGPEPSQIEAWSAMNYGPHLTHTYEIPGARHNFAYKGIAIRLDSGAGGVSRGRHWMVFDTDTLRVAAAWHAGESGSTHESFIDWRAIQFNGEHGVHPRIVGRVDFANGTGPGWGEPRSGSFQDDQRVLGRDGKQYGPLPQPWGRFRGIYHYDQQVILSYTIGTTEVLEAPRLLPRESSEPVILRSFNLGARPHDLVLQVAQHPASDALISELVAQDPSAVRVASVHVEPLSPSEVLRFDGETFVEIDNVQGLNVTDQDFSIAAQIKTKADGTIVSINDGGERWIPNGQTLFVRGGRLVFDIGWVGAVTGRSRIDDNQWHRVVMTWEQATQRVRLYVDGKLDGEGTLAAKAAVSPAVARIGFTSPNFPQPSSFFLGEIADVRFYQHCFVDAATDLSDSHEESHQPLSFWALAEQQGSRVADKTGNGYDGQVRRGPAPARPSSGPLVAGYAPRELPFEWLWEDG